MFYRMTRLHFDESRFAELTAWAETIRPRVEAVDGFLFADLVQTGEGSGMVIAAYSSESAFSAASDTVAEVMGEMSEYLTSAPHTHAGTVALSYGR